VATVLSARTDVDAITARAREARPGRMLLTVLAAVLFAVGWLFAQAVTRTEKAVGGLWLAVAWCWFAVVEGFRQARPAKPKAPRQR
jgi:drug/metabolite transporter superfamily protein YnfA